MAERAAAFVPMEDHPGEEMSAEALEDPIASAAEWSVAADEVAELLTGEERALDDRRRVLEPQREALLEAYEHPTRQQELAPGFLEAFDPLWEADPGGLVPDALLAAFLRGNLLKRRTEAAELYEEVARVLQGMVSGGDFALRETLAGAVFRASTSHRFAGNEERARELQDRGRGLADI